MSHEPTHNKMSSLTDETDILDYLTETKAENIQYINHKMYKPGLLIECIKIRPFCLYYVTDEFKNDINFLYNAFRANDRCMRWINQKYRNNEEFMLKCLAFNYSTVYYIGAKLSINKSFAIKAIQINCNVVRYLNHSLHSDNDIISLVLKINRSLLYYMNPEYNTIVKLLSEDGLLLKYFPGSCKLTEELILIAIKQNYNSYLHIDFNFKNDINFIKKLLITDYMVYTLLPEYERTDRDLVMFALKKNVKILQYLHKDFKYDLDILAESIILDKGILNKFEFPPMIKYGFYSYIKSYISEYTALQLFMFNTSWCIYINTTSTSTKHQKTIKPIITKLNCHGSYHSLKFKKIIFGYVGLKFDKKYELYNRALKNII